MRDRERERNSEISLSSKNFIYSFQVNLKTRNSEKVNVYVFFRRETCNTHIQSWEALTVKAQTYLASLIYSPNHSPLFLFLTSPSLFQLVWIRGDNNSKFSVMIINNTGIRLVTLYTFLLYIQILPTIWVPLSL